MARKAAMALQRAKEAEARVKKQQRDAKRAMYNEIAEAFIKGFPELVDVEAVPDVDAFVAHLVELNEANPFDTADDSSDDVAEDDASDVAAGGKDESSAFSPQPSQADAASVSTGNERTYDHVGY